METLSQIATDSFKITEDKNPSLFSELYFAAIEDEPKYILLDHFKFDPNSSIHLIEIYKNKTIPDENYARVYLHPNEDFVPSFVVAAKPQALHMAKRESIEPQSLNENLSWIHEFRQFMIVNKIFGHVSPFYFLRKCSFILDEIFSFVASNDQTYENKNYVNLLSDQNRMEYFSHLTSPDERSEINSNGNFGLIVSNSPGYVEQNKRYNWQRVKK